MKKKSKLRYSCWKCDNRFISWQKRDKHLIEDHKPPRKTIKVSKGRFYAITLLNGKYLKLGNLVQFRQKAVIKKITYTEGSKDVDVECEIFTDTYETK